MKRIITILSLAAALLLACSCQDKLQKKSVPAVVGEWQLVSIETKSVEYGGQTVDIYLSFTEDGAFELYQMIGQGRFYKYTGNWSVSFKTLSGKYSSGKAWGSDYKFAVKDDTLTLTSLKSDEVDVYSKVRIPDEVKDQAYEK